MPGPAAQATEEGTESPSASHTGFASLLWACRTLPCSCIELKLTQDQGNSIETIKNLKNSLQTICFTFLLCGPKPEKPDSLGGGQVTCQRQARQLRATPSQHRTHLNSCSLQQWGSSQEGYYQCSGKMQEVWAFVGAHLDLSAGKTFP